MYIYMLELEQYTYEVGYTKNLARRIRGRENKLLVSIDLGDISYSHNAHEFEQLFQTFVYDCKDSSLPLREHYTLVGEGSKTHMIDRLLECYLLYSNNYNTGS